MRHDIELINAEATKEGDELYVGTPELIAMIQSTQSGGTTVFLGVSEHSCKADSLPLLLDRIDYCKAGYASPDDPVACPARALAAAMLGRHSCGLDAQGVRKAMQGWLTPFEMALAERAAQASVDALPDESRTRAAPPRRLRG